MVARAAAAAQMAAATWRFHTFQRGTLSTAAAAPVILSTHSAGGRQLSTAARPPCRCTSRKRSADRLLGHWHGPARLDGTLDGRWHVVFSYPGTTSVTPAATNGPAGILAAPSRVRGSPCAPGVAGRTSGSATAASRRGSPVANAPRPAGRARRPRAGGTMAGAARRAARHGAPLGRRTGTRTRGGDRTPRRVPPRRWHGAPRRSART